MIGVVGSIDDYFYGRMVVLLYVKLFVKRANLICAYVLSTSDCLEHTRSVKSHRDYRKVTIEAGLRMISCIPYPFLLA